MHGYFLLRKNPAGKYSFDLKGGNHETLLRSEAYPSKDAVVDAIASVQKCATDDARFERMRGGDGSAFFLLKAGNAEAIGRSETFPSASAMEQGIASVKAYGGSTEVRDIA